VTEARSFGEGSKYMVSPQGNWMPPPRENSIAGGNGIKLARGFGGPRKITVGQKVFFTVLGIKLRLGLVGLRV